jgi:ABC-2 type transport system ATP-binding protein
MSLTVTELTGGYTRTPVIKDLSFEVAAGEIVGLIGLNGAGKSTTIKHIMGLMEPFSGEIKIDGLTLKKDPVQYRKKISFVPETPMVYRSLTLKEHLEMTAMAYDIPFETVMERTKPLLKLFRLDERLEWFPQDFSKGMKQKVMITSALITDPDVMVIDEPFIGLDPIAIWDFERLLLERKAKGNALLMSTHVLRNAEKICDSFVILNDGVVFAKGTTEELSEQFNLPTADLEQIYRFVAQEEGFRHDA